MKVLVLNGSPKGEYCITLQTSLYLEKKFPNHEFSVLHVGQKIKSLEKDFTAVAEAITAAELLIFSYPVYTFIAPSQLHRFIELLKASGIDLKGKFATQITTSKHFYDVTAHKYIEENCRDLGLKYIKGLSADMDDLLTEGGQKAARDFFAYVCWCVENNVYNTVPVNYQTPKHKPVSMVTLDSDKKDRDVVIVSDYADKNNQDSVITPNCTDKNYHVVVIVTDCAKEDVQLNTMIERFRAVLNCKSRLVNISEYPMRGGCLGCLNCATTGKCIYTDGFDEFLRKNIQTAGAIIYAFSIKDHSMGSIFKMYDDRQFCNGHRSVTAGKPTGYLISGNYSSEANLQMIIEGLSEVGENYLAGVATDETDPDTEIDFLAARLEYAINNNYIQPRNFYGVGGMKIFRDLIWLMRGMMKADHRFYKKHKLYDFPQKKRATALKMYLVGALISSPKLKAKIGNKMNEGMIAPYKKILQK